MEFVSTACLKSHLEDESYKLSQFAIILPFTRIQAKTNPHNFIQTLSRAELSTQSSLMPSRKPPTH